MNPHAHAGMEIWLPSTGRNSDFNNDFYVPWSFPDTVRNVSSRRLRCRAGSSYLSPGVAVMGIWHLFHGNKRPVINRSQGTKTARGERGEETQTQGEKAPAYPHVREKQAGVDFCCREARMTGKALHAPGKLLRNSLVQDTSTGP